MYTFVLLYEFPEEAWLTVYRRLDIAKRARVGPRTQIVFTLKIMVPIKISSKLVRRSDMIVLDNVFKFSIELLKTIGSELL